MASSTATYLIPLENIKEAVDKCLTNVKNVQEIRPKQLETVVSIVRRQDCLCILPTGGGKSLIYQVLPAVLKDLKINMNPIIVVVSPLIALIKDQVKEANNLHPALQLSAVKIESSIYSDVLCGKYNLLFGTPEQWLNNNTWRNILSSKVFVKNCVCIVIDEVHKVVWGEASNNAISCNSGKPFREVFKRLKELRSLCREDVPVLALTATADVDISQLIKTSCGLSRSVNVITSCSDRKNIRLSIVKINNKNINCLNWIIDSLKKYKENSPKIIIYAQTVKLVGWLYEKILFSLGSEAYLNQSKKKSQCLVGMFHAQTPDKNKKRVLESLTTENKLVRLVIATSSLGCGINASNVTFIVHFGPSYGLADYCQQIGRAGRNTDEQCHAVIYTYGNFKSVSDDMKSYILLSKSQCLRYLLFTPFNEQGNSVNSVIPGHTCCCFCSEMCDCKMGSCTKLFIYEKISEIEESNSKIFYRDVSPGDKEEIEKLLLEYKSEIPVSSSSFLFVPLPFVKDITDDCISSIVKNLSYINNIKDIIQISNIVDKRVAIDVINILSKVIRTIPSVADSFSKFSRLSIDVCRNDETDSDCSSLDSFGSKSDLSN